VRPVTVERVRERLGRRRPLLRAAERTATGPGGVRDRAIACVLLFTGLRIAELVALDTGDLSISARKGRLTVRRGSLRRAASQADGPALFLSLKGQRLSGTCR